MSETGKERFILTKSYEVAYALFRIASGLHENDFAERLRANGAALLQAAAVQDHAPARHSLQVIEALVKFAGDVNMMSAANADTLLREIYVLDAAIVERMQTPRQIPVNLSELFSSAPEFGARMDMEAEAEVETRAQTRAASGAVEGEMENGVDEHEDQNSSTFSSTSRSSVSHRSEAKGSSSHSEGRSFMKSEMRQSTILEKIRKSGNCRIRDLQDILPDCSERTIRYDLQSLLERNLIERMGSGGPAVSYRIRQSV